jgi:SAM-dependent methyltransferase
MIKNLSPSEADIKFNRKNKNLYFLLSKRFGWMKKYIKNKRIIIEIGSGSGSAKNFLGKKVISTDIIKHKNIDFKLDMNKMNLPKKFRNKVDIFILNHSLHHSNNPIKVIHNLQKNLKLNGLILINEPEISLVFKIFLKVFDVENWNLDLSQINKKNFWLQNNATGRILFDKKKIGSHYNKKLLIKKNLLNEFLIFLNSSGNSVEAPHIKLNNSILSIVNKFDDIITTLFPSIFALNRSIILKKINE